MRLALKRLKVKHEFLHSGLITVGILAVATGIGFLFQSLGFTEENIIIVYVLGVLVIAAITANRGWSIFASVFSVLLFNFLFTVPRFSFAAYASGYPVTFVIAFLAALIASNLAIQLKRQAEISAKMAARTQMLLETNQILQKAEDVDEILEKTANQIVKLFGRTAIFYRNTKEGLKAPVLYPVNPKIDENRYLSEQEYKAAAEVLKQNGEVRSDQNCMYFLVGNTHKTYGVIGIVSEKQRMTEVEENFLQAILGECALALEKEYFNRKREEAVTKAKNEQLRANLLRSISHDLRTPLTSISGNADILLSEEIRLEQAKRRQLYTDIYEASMWLISLVENLLSITRIEDGTMNLNLQVELVDEVVEEALKHLTRKSTEHIITFQPSDEILLAKMDSRLIMQVVINLVDNAVKYTPPGSRIEVTTEKKGEWVCVSVSDNGNGITDEMKEKIFDMFYTGTGQASDSRRGLGLGLFLVKAIIQAHGGTIRVKDGKTDGTIFTFRLKAEEVTLDEQTTDSCSGR